MKKQCPDRQIRKEIFPTPLGWAAVAASGQGICRIVLPKKTKAAAEHELQSTGAGIRSAREKTVVRSQAALLLKEAVRLLKRYFSGKPVVFDLPLDLRYYTAFQQAVWRAAREISSGETRSYRWIAERIKRPGAARAVGQAMGANPIPVIIP